MCPNGKQTPHARPKGSQGARRLREIYALVLNSGGQSRAGVRTVKTDGGSDREAANEPVERRTGDGELALLNVVRHDVLEANVRVQQQGHRENTVHHAGHAVLRRGDSADGNERGRDQALKGPVVRAVRRIGLGVYRRVVHSAVDVGCSLVLCPSFLYIQPLEG